MTSLVILCFQGPNKPAEVVTIPIGSTNIFAEMKEKNGNMLGM